MVAGKRCPAESVAVVAVPFPAQGHLNQLLHLSLQLASHGLPVHYAAPMPHLRQACERLHGWDRDADLRCIQFHDLAIPAFVSPPADPSSGSLFPSHLMPMLETYTSEARAPLAALLKKISAAYRRVVVLFDIMNAFAAQEAARLPNCEAFGFVCIAFSSIAGELAGGRRLLRERGLDYLPVSACVTDEFAEYLSKRSRAGQSVMSGAGILANTCRSLEGEFIDLVAKQLARGGKKVFAIGPLNPLLGEPSRPRQGKTQHECLDWLDKQPPSSVLYVSFGSTSSLRPEQVEELAEALCGSNQRFIWVLRHADRSNIFTEDGEIMKSQREKVRSKITKQAEGRGLVVTGWAPQLEILAHSATAAFMSHCGWNSTMESLSHGKPILAWPMHTDQPWDAELICKYLNTGIFMRPWDKRGEVIPAPEIMEVVEKVMVSNEGLALRRRAMMLGEEVRTSMAVGGSSAKDLEEFVAHITRGETSPVSSHVKHSRSRPRL